jgi:hypothetical protein
VRRKYFGTLMRHFLAVGAHAIGVAAGAEVAALIAPARLTQRRGAGGAAARDGAVAIAAVAATAEEEELAAFDAAADDEAQRVQSESLARKNWTLTSSRATRCLPPY